MKDYSKIEQEEQQEEQQQQEQQEFKLYQKIYYNALYIFNSNKIYQYKKLSDLPSLSSSDEPTLFHSSLFFFQTQKLKKEEDLIKRLCMFFIIFPIEFVIALLILLVYLYIIITNIFVLSFLIVIILLFLICFILPLLGILIIISLALNLLFCC